MAATGRSGAWGCGDSLVSLGFFRVCVCLFYLVDAARPGMLQYPPARPRGDELPRRATGHNRHVDPYFRWKSFRTMHRYYDARSDVHINIDAVVVLLLVLLLLLPGEYMTRCAAPHLIHY